MQYAWSFEGTNLPGVHTKKAPRGVYLTVIEVEDNPEKGGAAFVFKPVPNSRDLTGVLVDTNVRAPRKFIPYPTPEKTWPTPLWMKLFNVALNIPEDQLKGMRGTPFDPIPHLNGRQIFIDYTPDASENTYTDKDGKEKTGKNDDLWLLNQKEAEEVLTRLRAEAAGQPAPTTAAKPATTAVAPVAGFQVPVQQPPAMAAAAPVQQPAPTVPPVMAPPMNGGGGAFQIPGVVPQQQAGAAGFLGGLVPQ